MWNINSCRKELYTKHGADACTKWHFLYERVTFGHHWMELMWSSLSTTILEPHWKVLWSKHCFYAVRICEAVNTYNYDSCISRDTLLNSHLAGMDWQSLMSVPKLIVAMYTVISVIEPSCFQHLPTLYRQWRLVAGFLFFTPPLSVC